MLFPDYRPRRLRKNESFRRMIRETYLIGGPHWCVTPA